MLLAIGIAAGFALVEGDDPATLNLLGFDIETNDRGIFVAGALCALAVLVAFQVIAIGCRRVVRRRRELRELRETVDQTTTERLPEVHHHRRSRSSEDDDEEEESDERDHFDSTPRD